MREWGVWVVGFLTKVDEGVVDIVGIGATRENVVGGVRRGEEGDVRVC